MTFGFNESRTVAPGREPVVVVVDGVRVGLTVCYDIAFLPLYRAGARRGAQLIAAVHPGVPLNSGSLPAPGR